MIVTCKDFYFSVILDRMSPSICLWVVFGTLFPLLLALGAAERSGKETLLKSIPSRGTPPTDCLMECTGKTYIRKSLLQDNRNIWLKDSTEGDLGEHCWSAVLQCNIGESLLHAYVVLPVDMSAAGHEQLEVKSTFPTASTLHVHDSPTTIEESCGLRYDVTQHFGTQNAGTSFCVVTREDKLLRCRPFLVTFWQRNPNQSNQQGGG